MWGISAGVESMLIL